MKLFNIQQFKTLLKIFFTDYFSNIGTKGKEKKQKKNQLTGKMSDRTKSPIVILSTIIGGAFILGYLVYYVYSLTIISVENGNVSDVPYLCFLATQLFVMFFGIGSLINYMYFSEDNTLLLSLPVTEMTIFAAKFTFMYLLEIAFSSLILLPSLITYGITAAAYGVTVGVGFYIFAVISPLMAPLFPMLAVALLSIPIMYLLTFAKNRTLAKNLLSYFTTFGILAIYLVCIFSVNMIDYDEGGTAVAIPPVVFSLAKVGIFNYNWIEAMLGNNVAVNAILYIAYSVAVFGLILLLSALCYKKTISLSLEEGKRRKRKGNKSEKITSGSFMLMLIIKDVKIIIGEPALLLSTVFSLVMLPILTLISRLMTFDFFDTVYSGELIMLGFFTYIVTILSSGTNYSSLLGISLEGKNLSLLKTLPISAGNIIKSKLITANILNLLISIEYLIVFSIILTSSLGPLFAFIGAVFIFVFSFGMSCLGLYNDLKKPTLVWDNIQKLTRNNTRTIKPMLMAMGLGMLYLISAIAFGILLGDRPEISFSVYFLVLGLTASILAIFSGMSLWRQKDELLERIEC